MHDFPDTSTFFFSSPGKIARGVGTISNLNRTGKEQGLGKKAMKRRRRRRRGEKKDEHLKKRRKIENKSSTPPNLNTKALEQEERERKIDQLGKTYTETNKVFNIENVLNFVDESRINKTKYIHFDNKTVELYNNLKLETTIYTLCYGNKIGIYCSLVEVKTQMLLNGTPKNRLIPNKRIRDFGKLAYWIDYFLGRDDILESTGFNDGGGGGGNSSNFIVNLDDHDQFWVSGSKKKSLLRKYMRKSFELAGCFMLIKELRVPPKYVHFNGEDVNSGYGSLYFDDKTNTTGFFISYMQVKKIQENGGIVEGKRIPTKKIRNYLDLIGHVEYLEVYDKDTRYKSVIENDPDYKPE